MGTRLWPAVGGPMRFEAGTKYDVPGILSRLQRITYGLRAKGCYTDTQRRLESYAETIYIVMRQ